MSLRPGDAFFSFVHRRHLVYNTCWEDPRLDREALALGPADTVVMITSAGCNALDYALDAPARIVAVDLNPRQTALLELKQAAIRTLSHDDAFAVFGRGHSRHWRDAYQSVLRPQLSRASQSYWDHKGSYFSGRGWRPSFYFRGTAGVVARVMNLYLDHVVGGRDDVLALLDARSLDEQRAIYDRRLRHGLWRPWLRWFARQPALLAMLAVPRPQREHLERDVPGGIAAFIEGRLESVLTTVPITDNYFWRVYLTGRYSPSCCPEYLTPAGFARLKAGLVDRIETHTASLIDWLRADPRPVTRFVLLDHMDWLCDRPDVLGEEWREILGRAAPGARVLWRSGGATTPFVDALPMAFRGRRARLGDWLTYAHDQAARLHRRDRVHTYGSFQIATVSP